MLELGLIATLGFLGSFGHCVGMCGPIAIAFSLSQSSVADPENTSATRWQRITFHLLLNLGRLLSYALVGAAIGGLGSVLVAGGQMAGVGSILRRGIALLTGILLIALGLKQVAPKFLPRLPLLHPLQGALHNQLQQAMTYTAQNQRWWTPALLGLAWGLIPCGFLYAAQIKAAETSSFLWGTATMVAFGLGTLPVMVGLGVSSAWFSRDRTSQLFQLGGWITLLIGVLTLLRTGDLMVDYAGHLSLLFLGLALIARPISKLWSQPLKFRRLLGVGAFVLAVAHTAHMLEHSWNWNPVAVRFMLPQHQWGMVAGGIGLALMLPLTLTSTDQAQRRLGNHWRSLHLLSIPAILLCGLHVILAGSQYLGSLQWHGRPLIHTLVLGLGLIMVMAIRSPLVWKILGLSKWYASPRAANREPAKLPTHHC
ncbi:MAG: sulfite exporter TauE/SafE family protein [Leptolyngbya sp. SIO1D8]|nr:sulfite exporter TauE/SafE family protein [Leptolyngbya sp. SIO1D8]